MLTLLANSEATVWTAMLGGKPRSKPRCLIGFWASSGLIVDFANSVTNWAEYDAALRRRGNLTVWFTDDGVPRTYWQRWQCGAAHEMRGGPSEPAVRGRLQTASSCIGQEPVW